MTPAAAGPLEPASSDDIDEMATLWGAAFPSRGAAERARELREEGLTYGTLGDCWVVRERRAVVGALRTYRLTLHARGRTWPTLGLAGVAVAPDHRRRGLGGRMCTHALRIGRSRGAVLAALYPFRTSFYAALGFGLVGTLHRHRFVPSDLPLYPGWERVTRLRGPGEVRAVYEAAAARSTGLVGRPEAAWRFLHDPRVGVFVHPEAGGDVTGYVVTRTQRGRAGQRLRVVELVALDLAAYEALLGWISAQGDQFAEVVHDALPGERLEARLRDARRIGGGRPRGLWMDAGAVLFGPMLRLLDPAAVQARDAEEGFSLADLQLPENTGWWRGGKRLEPAAGAQAVGPGEAAARFLAGTLPGEIAPPPGWSPVPFGEEFRLLDEF